MDRYKIKLYGGLFLHVTHKYLENILTESFHPYYTHLPYTSNMFDQEEDLDLFQATVWKNRLTKLGVECEIVKIDYSKEP